MIRPAIPNPSVTRDNLLLNAFKMFKHTFGCRVTVSKALGSQEVCGKVQRRRAQREESSRALQEIHLVMEFMAGGELYDRLFDAKVYNEAAAERGMRHDVMLCHAVTQSLAEHPWFWSCCTLRLAVTTILAQIATRCCAAHGFGKA